MAVRFAMIHSTSTAGDLPTETANTTNIGINAQGGAYEYIVLRYDLTFAADPTAADLLSIFDALRIVINGEVVFDWRAGYGDNTLNAASPLSYFVNSIAGRAYELPSGTTTREGYLCIPLGRSYANSVNRIEIITQYGAAAGAISSGTLQWWLKFNPNYASSTTIVPSTSFNHTANAIEQVVVRVPQNITGVVTAVLVQNDSAADELGTQGIRVQALGDYGFEASMWRWLNGDMLNGIMYADNDASTTQQTFAVQTDGALLLPVFGLAGGDIVLQVDSSSTTVRTYTPVITSPAGARQSAEVRQTQPARSNVAQAVASRTEN
jgi:hypothetical protein